MFWLPTVRETLTLRLFRGGKGTASVTVLAHSGSRPTHMQLFCLFHGPIQEVLSTAAASREWVTKLVEVERRLWANPSSLALLEVGFGVFGISFDGKVHVSAWLTAIGAFHSGFRPCRHALLEGGAGHTCQAKLSVV